MTSSNACEPGEQLIVLANGDDESDLVGWSLLLLAATVRSSAHMPLGISDRNTIKSSPKPVLILNYIDGFHSLNSIFILKFEKFRCRIRFQKFFNKIGTGVWKCDPSTSEKQYPSDVIATALMFIRTDSARFK